MEFAKVSRKNFFIHEYIHIYFLYNYIYIYIYIYIIFIFTYTQYYIMSYSFKCPENFDNLFQTAISQVKENIGLDSTCDASSRREVGFSGPKLVSSCTIHILVDYELTLLIFKPSNHLKELSWCQNAMFR